MSLLMDGLESPQQALRRAVRLAGGQIPFARLIGRSQSGISKQLKEGRPLQAEFVLKVEDATGVSRFALRPDIYQGDTVPTARSMSDDRLDGLRG